MIKAVKYPKAERKDLNEALGITKDVEETVRSQIESVLEAEDIIDIHRAAIEMLEETDKHLDEYIAAYEKDKNDREPVEKVYGLKISILDSLARRFNPFTVYGKTMLADAVKCRKEFEALVGPMITRITANNIDLFKTVISESIREDILSGRREALGAFRTLKKTVYGVGVIVFHTDNSNFYPNGSLTIDWLYVNHKFRERAIAHFLIGELLNSAADRGIEDVSVEYPIDLSEKKILGYVLGTWHFELQTTLNPDAIIKISDITSYKEIKEYNKGAKAVSSLGESKGIKVVREALKRFGYHGYLLNPNLAVDYIDQDLSFYMGAETDVSAMLISHRTGSGMMRVDYIGTKAGAEERSLNLISAFLEKVVKALSDDDLVYIPVESEEDGEFLEKISSKQMGQYLLYGDLCKPSPDMDITPEDVERFLEEAE